MPEAVCDEPSHEDRLRRVFREFFRQPSLEIGRDTTAQDVKGWDSFAHVQLILRIEREFKIRLQGREILGLKNVGQMLDLLGQKLRA